MKDTSVALVTSITVGGWYAVPEPSKRRVCHRCNWEDDRFGLDFGLDFL